MTMSQPQCPMLMMLKNCVVTFQRRIGVKNGQQVQRLKTELATYHQQSLAIEIYYIKLIQLWRSMADYQQAKTMEEV